MTEQGGLSSLYLPLPAELFGIITEYFDDQNTLLALRLASKAFDAYFAPLRFRKSRVKGSVKSADMLKEMLNSKSPVICFIKHIHIEFEVVNDMAIDENLCSNWAVNEEVVEAFRVVWPLLATITLPISVTILLKEDRALSFLTQPFSLEGISHFPAGTLISLSVVGFSPMLDPILTYPNFRSALASLESLHLAILPKMQSYHLSNDLASRPGDFWESHEIGNFFSSLQALKSLSICTAWFPIMPGPHFGALFPHLESLTPEGCLFGWAAGIHRCGRPLWPTPQSFVVAHKRSLKSLKLKICPVYVREPGNPSPRTIPTAAEVWREFTKELTILESVDVRFEWPDYARTEKVHDGSRQVFYMQCGPHTWELDRFSDDIKSLEPDPEDDDKALAQFIASVRER